MKLTDLTIDQLRRAAAIKERIEDLNKQLHRILGTAPKPGAAPKKNQGMSAAVKKRIAASQRARWAKIKAAAPAAASARPAAKATKSR